MKIGDYRRLGKISIKSRKKSTRNTVTGISFGLIMLIPIVFFTLAFYIGLTGTINKTRTTSCFHVPSRNVYDTAPRSVQKGETNNGYTSYSGLAMNTYGDIGGVSARDQVEETVVGELYSLSGFSGYSTYGNQIALSMTLDGKLYGMKRQDQNKPQDYRNSVKPGRFKVLNWELSGGRWHTSAEVRDLDKREGRLLSAGEGFTAASKGKTEILVSEHFLSAFGVTDAPANLVGKKLSLTVNLPAMLDSGAGQYYVLDQNTSSDEDTLRQTFYTIPYLQDFVVAGVISKDYYKLPSNAEEANVVVTSASVYFDAEDYASYYPTVTYESDPEGGIVPGFRVRYGGGIAKTAEAAAKNGMMLHAVGAMTFDTYSGRLSQMSPESSLLIPALDHKIQCTDYAAATKLSKSVEAELKKVYPGADDMGGLTYYYANELFSNFAMINTIGGYLMLVLYAFGGIIFFATMLNLYNSVNYSVEARRNYIGVMRAIGAKEKTIPALYFFEIILIFLRALPWVLIFSGLLSFGIKFGIDKAFEYAGEMLGVVIKLNFAFFFVTLAAALAVVFLIALAFSQIACKNVAHKPILDVLSDDKG